MEIIKDWLGYNKQPIVNTQELSPEDKLFQQMKENPHVLPLNLTKSLLTKYRDASQNNNINWNQNWYLYDSQRTNSYYNDPEIFELLLSRITLNDLPKIVQFYKEKAFIDGKFIKLIKKFEDQLKPTSDSVDPFTHPTKLLYHTLQYDIDSSRMLIILGQKLTSDDLIMLMHIFKTLPLDISKRLIDICPDMCHNNTQLLTHFCCYIKPITTDESHPYEELTRYIMTKIKHKKLFDSESLLYMCMYGTMEMLIMALSHENVNCECTLKILECQGGIFLGNKYTLLHWACLNRPKIISILMDAGANPNVPNDLGYTPNTFRKILNQPELTIVNN